MTAIGTLVHERHVSVEPQPFGAPSHAPAQQRHGCG